MKNYELYKKNLTEFELRNLMIASLQNKLCIEMAKDKCLCGEDEPAKKEKENLSYNRQSI